MKFPFGENEGKPSRYGLETSNLAWNSSWACRLIKLTKSKKTIVIRVFIAAGITTLKNIGNKEEVTPSVMKSQYGQPRSVQTAIIGSPTNFYRVFQALSET
jgi:hypothetical protein